MINEQSIRQWWDVFKATNPLTEVRILGNGKTFSGYYTDVDSLLRDIRQYDGYGIYCTINAIKDSCYGRTQRDCIVPRPKATTSDNDIEARTTILIDLDPKRSSDTNASDEEKGYARVKAREIFKYLSSQGFEKPVVADSANGYHLLYKVYLANSPEVNELIKNFLLALDMMFSDDKVEVDTSVFNASRISKLIGTSSNKGTNTADRPQRLSSFLFVPDEFKENDVAYIRKVAGEYPQSPKPDKSNNYTVERFDLRGFISEHGIEVVRECGFSGGTKFVLKECPFDKNHKDAAVFLLDNGAVAFKCFHASCQQYHWRDFRLHYDPQAYDRKTFEEFDRKVRYNAPVRQEDLKPVEEDARGKKWMMASEFTVSDLKDAQAIPMGIPALDKKILGLILGEVSIVTGSSGAGKSTFLNHLILTAVQRNYHVAMWSGEMKGGRVISWLDQMAAGRGYVQLVPGTDNLYSVPPHIRKKINDWLGDRFYLYNNAYGQKWSQLSSDIEKCISKNKTNLVLVDNLMALTLDSYAGESNDRQSEFINNLSDLAKSTNTHILLVCHPRKENVNQLIRKESVAGTADLTNRVDNLFLLHRVSRDFERRGKDFFGPMAVQELLNYNLVIEVNKARTAGYQDLLVGVYYEQETRRLKNEMAENIIYGWEETPVQQIIEDMPDFTHNF